MDYLQMAQALEFYKPQKLTIRELKAEVFKTISHYPEYAKDLADNNERYYPPTVRTSIHKIANAILDKPEFKFMVSMLA
jgi:hypothetical protein